jgi:hypothetical protein
MAGTIALAVYQNFQPSQMSAELWTSKRESYSQLLPLLPNKSMANNGPVCQLEEASKIRKWLKNPPALVASDQVLAAASLVAESCEKVGTAIGAQLAVEAMRRDLESDVSSDTDFDSELEKLTKKLERENGKPASKTAAQQGDEVGR